MSTVSRSSYYSQLPQEDSEQQQYQVFPVPSHQADSPRKETSRLARPLDENGHEIREFYTDYGTQRVSIDGDLSDGRPVLMTFHDIGINHAGCFLSFFNMLRAHDSKFSYFNIVHIDAPRHHYDSATTAADGRSSTSSEAGKTRYGSGESDGVEAYDLLELSTQIEEIRSKLQIEKFVGVAVGAACNVFTHYAMNYSHRLRGLILINGVGCGPSWREWLFDAVLASLGTSSQTMLDSFNGSLLTRYFPKAMTKETYDYFLDEFERMDTRAAVKYFRGFVARKEFDEQQLKKIKCKTLVLCGEFSRVKEETIAFQKMLPKSTTTFVLMRDVGFLLTESCPQKLCSSIDLFMQSLGFTSISMRRKYGTLPENQEGDTAL